MPKQQFSNANNAKNNEQAVNKRRRRVGELYLQGYTQWAVAQEVGVSQAQVSKDLAALREEWMHDAVMSFDSRMAQELAKIDHVEEVAWESFLISREDSLVKSKEIEKALRVPKVETGRDGKPLPAKPGVMVPISQKSSVKRTTQRSGEAKWMEIILNCIDKRLRVCGILDADRNQTTNNIMVLPDDFWDKLQGRETPENDALNERIRQAGIPRVEDKK